MVHIRTPICEGFAAWRRILQLLRGRGEVRLELTMKVQRPEATTTKVSGAALAKWGNVREFTSGGRPLSFAQNCNVFRLTNVVHITFRLNLPGM